MCVDVHQLRNYNGDFILNIYLFYAASKQRLFQQTKCKKNLIWSHEATKKHNGNRLAVTAANGGRFVKTQLHS